MKKSNSNDFLEYGVCIDFQDDTNWVSLRSDITRHYKHNSYRILNHHDMLIALRSSQTLLWWVHKLLKYSPISLPNHEYSASINELLM